MVFRSQIVLGAGSCTSEVLGITMEWASATVKAKYIGLPYGWLPVPHSHIFGWVSCCMCCDAWSHYYPWWVKVWARVVPVGWSIPKGGGRLSGGVIRITAFWGFWMSVYACCPSSMMMCKIVICTRSSSLESIQHLSGNAGCHMVSFMIQMLRIGLRLQRKFVGLVLIMLWSSSDTLCSALGSLC